MAAVMAKTLSLSLASAISASANALVQLLPLPRWMVTLPDSMVNGRGL